MCAVVGPSPWDALFASSQSFDAPTVSRTGRVTRAARRLPREAIASGWAHPGATSGRETGGASLPYHARSTGTVAGKSRFETVGARARARSSSACEDIEPFRAQT